MSTSEMPELEVTTSEEEMPHEDMTVAVEENVAHEEVATVEDPTASDEVAEAAAETAAVLEEVVDSEMMESENEFAALGLSEEIVTAIERSGYTSPTPIQAQTIGHLLEGRDVLGQAQTGTGKTAAFALPLLQRIDLSNRRPQVLVLTPTRELAIQLAKQFEKYAQEMGPLQVVSVYGGQDYQIQLRPLSRGCHIVVGTPGRVMDHIRRGTLKLDDMKCLVLDEADEMLRMGFAEDVDWVLSQAPAERQMALFSATMPKPIREIAQKHLNKPAEVTIKQKTATADTIRQRYFIASPHQKQAALSRILEAEDTDGVLIFVKMRSTTEPLADFLAAAGHKTAALNGDIAQKQRERIVERLRAGKIDIIVATDVAARGLDVNRISHVVNYDLPHDSEAYIHRIGRTGRAGRSGEAILFVHPRERYSLKRLEQATRHTIEPMELPSNRVINKKRVADFHGRISAALEHAEIDTFKSIISQFQRDNEDVSVEAIAAAMAVMVNGDTPILVTEKLKAASFAPDSKRDNRYGNKKREFGSKRRDTSYKSDSELETYRIEVGRNHRVLPGNIVGAIANEAGIGNGSIGKIKIFDRFSTIDLPQGLSNDVITHLQNVSIAGQKLRISRMGESRGGRSGGGNYGKGRSNSRPTGTQNQQRAFNRSSFKKYAGKKNSGSTSPEGDDAGKIFTSKKFSAGKSQRRKSTGSTMPNGGSSFKKSKFKSKNR